MTLYSSSFARFTRSATSPSITYVSPVSWEYGDPPKWGPRVPIFPGVWGPFSENGDPLYDSWLTVGKWGTNIIGLEFRPMQGLVNHQPCRYYNTAINLSIEKNNVIHVLIDVNNSSTLSLMRIFDNKLVAASIQSFPDC